MSNQIWAGFAGLTGINDLSNEEPDKKLSQNRETPVENNCGLDAEAIISIAWEEVGSGSTRTLQIDDETIDLNIPAGIENGQRLRLRGKGNTESATGRRGDLYIIIELTGTPSLDQNKPTDRTGTDDPWFSHATAEDDSPRTEVTSQDKQKKKEEKVYFKIGEEHGGSVYHEIVTGNSSNYIRGIPFDNFGHLYLYKSPQAKSAEITKIYIVEDEIIESGKKLLEITETCIDGTISVIDLVYESELVASAYSVAMAGTAIEDEMEAMTLINIYVRDIEIPDEGSHGIIRMPMVSTKNHPYIIVKWKAQIGAVAAKGETICIIELDDGDQSLGIQRLKAPCKLCITKSADYFDSSDSVKLGGILLEYMRLPEVINTSTNSYDEAGPTILVCVKFEEGSTHWLIKEWHCSKGTVEAETPICTITENNYNAKTFKTYQITAKIKLTIAEILAEEGSLLEIGDKLAKIEELAFTPAMDLVTAEEIIPLDAENCVTFAPLYEGNTHCKALTISDALAKGSVKEGEEIMRLECFENNDTSKVECIAKLIALMDINNINLLAEKGAILNSGDKIISAPILKSIATPDAIRVDLNDGFVRFVPLFDGNSHSQVLSISDALARRSIKKGGELMKLECYGDHDHSEIKFIGTVIALMDLEGINLEVKEGASLEPGDKIFFAPIFEKMQPHDAIRVDVNAFTAKGQKSLDAAVSYFREAKSFDATMILSRLHQDKKLQLQILREVSNKRNASISAGTALASVAATATGFGAVASILSLMRMAYQSSHKNGEVDNDLEQGTQTAEEIRQLLTNQRSRLGEAQGRFIGIDRDNDIRMYCVTQSASRGLHIIELSYAGNTDYLESGALRNCLANSFNDEELAEIWGMLLPTSTQAIKGIRLISSNEALDNDQFYQILSGVGSAYRVELENSNRLYVYKLPIPHHSDF